MIELTLLLVSVRKPLVVNSVSMPILVARAMLQLLAVSLSEILSLLSFDQN